MFLSRSRELKFEHFDIPRAQSKEKSICKNVFFELFLLTSKVFSIQQDKSHVTQGVHNIIRRLCFKFIFFDNFYEDEVTNSRRRLYTHLIR